MDFTIEGIKKTLEELPPNCLIKPDAMFIGPGLGEAGRLDGIPVIYSPYAPAEPAWYPSIGIIGRDQESVLAWLRTEVPVQVR
jgi:hypothetical protein